MSTEKLIPAIQLTDERLLLEALDALEGAGFACASEEVTALEMSCLPDWAQPERGGWLLQVDAERFEEAMEFLGDMMGDGD